MTSYPTEEAWLTPKPPFDFHLTAGYQANFGGGSATDFYSDGSYRRLIEIGGQPRLLSLASASEGLLSLWVSGPNLAPEDLSQAERAARWLLATELDLSPFYAMAHQDPGLSRLIQLCHGFHPPRTATVFEGLVLAITGQQISAVVARKLGKSLIQTFGPTLEVDGHRYHSFPSPQRLAQSSEGELRAMGFSWMKASYILSLAWAAADGALDLDGLHGLDEQEVAQRLLPLRGVGQWTVEWLLTRALGHLDAFPAGDLALRRTISRLYFQGQEITPAQARAFAERWRPYRGYVTSYIFAVLRQGIALRPAQDDAL